LDKENLTIINIYDARTSNEWALMWKQLNEANFDTSHVIIGRDFNHLEDIDRRRKAKEHSLLVLTIWGQPTKSSKWNRNFDSSLLRVETCKATMVKAWKIETPKPTREVGWAP
jgi:hypothetical protein